MMRHLLCVWAVLTATPELSAHRLPIQVYTTAQGLPRNTIACLVPGRQGLLWICTSEGLVRFDGSEFRTFNRDQGLPSSVILDFLVARDGGYWLLTDVGLCRLQAGSKIGSGCTLLSVDKIEGDFQPASLVESHDGRIWTLTDRALYRSSFDGRKLERIEGPSGGSETIFSVGEASGGQLLVATERAVYAWDGRSYRAISGPAIAGCGFGQVHRGASGESWVVGNCNIYRVAARGPAGNLEMEQVGNIERAGQIVVRRDRSIWVSAPPGLRRYELQPDGSLQEKERLGTADGLPSAWINDLAEDGDGNIWGSTEGLGVFRIQATGFRVYDTADGLGSARISSIFESLRGDLCVTTSAEVGSPAQSQFRARNGDRFDRIDFQRAPNFHDWGWGWSQIALQAHDGEWWYQTDTGVYRFPKTNRPRDLIGLPPSRVYDRHTPLLEDNVFRIFEDSHGDVWMTTIDPHNALIRWDRATGQFHHWTAAEGWPGDSGAQVLRESPGGTIWIGTAMGVLRLRDGRFERLSMPSNPVFTVRDMRIGRGGSLWVATARNGVYRCDNSEALTPVCRHYGMHDGLSSDSTRSLTEDDAGLIYVGTVRAVDRIDPRASGGANILHFTAADGLPEADQNVSYRDHRGHLWFGTMKGLAEYAPTQAAVSSIPPVYIRRLRVRGEDIPLPWEGTQNFQIHLPSDKNQLEIEYAGIDLRSVASVRYQYRLSGVDSDWTAASQRFSVNYANIPPGERRFEVRAVGADGVAGSVAALSLGVDAPVWRRAWFLALAVLTLGAGGYWLYSYRVAHLIALERIRTRIATDLHDDIGSSLTQISVLTEIADRDPSRRVLGEVAIISRDIVDEMSDIVWAVSPRHDRFDSIAHRMRRFAEDAMADGELKFDASELPADLPMPLELRRPLYLVFKEAVNNVARHSQATRMTVRIAARHGMIELSVEDNGRGFDQSAQSHGEGLASMRRRLKEVSGTAKWDTAPGRGTRFEASLPLRVQGSGLFSWVWRAKREGV